MITSPQNAHLKMVRKLHTPRGRRKLGAFLVEGVRLTEEAWQSGASFRLTLYSRPLSPRGQRLLDALRQSGCPVEEVAPALLADVSGTETPQNLLAVLDLPDIQPPQSPDFIVIADQVRDPGNLGTLLRTSAAAGAQAFFIPDGTTDPFAPKVVRAGMGAHFRLPIIRQKWDEIVQYARAQGLKLFVADMQGSQSCWEADLRFPLGLIIGGEAEGARAAARQSADGSLRIPMPGQMESLNAAAAGAILIFEVVRQRSKNP